MTYVFDTSPLSQLFRAYYRSRFPTLWEEFDELVRQERVTSTREVGREIDRGPIKELIEWKRRHPHLFPPPTAAEGNFVRRIFEVTHFQANIGKKTLLRGGTNADPFVVAHAGVFHRTVVTMEKSEPGGAKIGNICSHFDIACMSLEEFMTAEGWRF
ncbi:MAG: DUF4411 family protein [Acidobacteria bacterium]|nr:DUF4411 family protein [Gammaproteobacteria bacterium]MYK79641.1 DUF4411 family protein [Acidobacteriota bacterium]